MVDLVVTVESALLEKVRSALEQVAGVRRKSTTNKYEVFRLGCPGGSIVAYTSGKIVANGPTAASLLADAVASLGTAQTGVVVGSDEAGKGEWLGPLVVAAVALTPGDAVFLRSQGVMDSKQVHPAHLARLASLVAERSLADEVVLISPSTFEQRLTEMRSEGKNLNDLLAWAHTTAIAKVLRVISTDAPVTVVIDEFSREKMHSRLMRAVGHQSLTVIQRHRAEDEVAVAAASIVARARREKWIDDMSRHLGVDLRQLTPDDALAHPRRSLFAKISYLRRD